LQKTFLNFEEFAPNKQSIKAYDGGLYIENAIICNTQIKFDPDNELHEIIDA
jgi:hypothetical protein